ncbi:hypothetical protein AH4AK4_1012 [Aeromonas hydrophila 4AK4]|nr:hypothetical protein AH4AK4_1012 [Aeromonas hydrophila 4AK4]
MLVRRVGGHGRHGGLGIMLDDFIAGLFALFCMQLLARW